MARTGKILILGVAVIGTLALVAPLQGPPRLVWNASSSAPRGLYVLATMRSPRRGDLILATPPTWVAAFANRRGYLPLGVPLIKRIGGLAGDHICSDARLIRINGHVATYRLAEDSRHQPLPSWTGCRTLDSTQEFLLMAAVPYSFDGRYFGPTPIAGNIGRLYPLWTY